MSPSYENPNLEILRSPRFTVAIIIGDSYNKIFQIHYTKRDGTIIIDFPYYKKGPGLLAHSFIPANMSHLPSIDLTEGGKVTNKRVKFSYHPDGNVHFSQDGKIMTLIRKRTVPLIHARGHFFTVQMSGPEDFERVSTPSTKSRKRRSLRHYLNYQFDSLSDSSIKFLGCFIDEAEFANMVFPPTRSPFLTMKYGLKGDVYSGFVIAPPDGYPFDNKKLGIGVRLIPRMTSDNSSCLTFISGFDDPSIGLDLTKPTSFLALSYPSTDFDTLQKQIGTVDLKD